MALSSAPVRRAGPGGGHRLPHCPGASRATGQREAAERVLLCLEVLAERGLIDLETGPQGVAVSLRQVERKVDLEASPILGRLRQAIRGGSAGGVAPRREGAARFRRPPALL